MEPQDFCAASAASSRQRSSPQLHRSACSPRRPRPRSWFFQKVTTPSPSSIPRHCRSWRACPPAPIPTRSSPPTTANSPTSPTTAVPDSTLNTISVVDLVARKALPAIDLGALRSTHGLDFAGGKLYFTAETNKIIGRYDPGTQHVDWILGTGQDRTHMIIVTSGLNKIFTSNVNSATISIIEQTPRRAEASLHQAARASPGK